MRQKLDLGKRPKCTVKGCKRDTHFLGTYRLDGTPKFRKICSFHKNQKIKKANNVNHVHELTAKRKGISTTQYNNQWRPHLKHRKDYCENAKGEYAGWLGYKCTTKIVHEMQLDVDHIDGDPSNNESDNLMTLCKCCHAIKTNMFMDYATKGRKKLGLPR